MVVLKCIAGAVVGAVGGFIAACVIGWLVFIVGGLVMWDSNRGQELGSRVAGIVFYLGIGLGIVIPIISEIQTSKEADEAAERQRRAEDDRRQADIRRQHEELQRQILAARQHCSEAQSAVLSLPPIVAHAELSLDRAEEQLAKRRYSPFWEAIEDATAQLNVFDQRLQLIASPRLLHSEQVAKLGSHAPPFTLGVEVLPDPAPSHRRLLALYLRAQENRDFAIVYEQRRTTAKLDQTNTILLGGFRSLNEAIYGLGDRIVETLDHLGETVGFRLSAVQSSLEAAAEAAAQQRTALLSEIRRSAAGGEAVLAQLRKDSEDRLKHEDAARQMLDNIQRRRTPSLLE